MKPDKTRSPNSSTPRHGRIRRWLVRPFFWGLAVLTLVFFASVLYLDSEGFERRSSKWALGWLEARLGRQIHAGDVRLDLFPLVVYVRDIEISGETPESPAFARADRLVIEATVGSLLRPGILLDHVFVEAPQITVGFDEQGRHDAPRWSRRRLRTPQRPLLELEVGLLEVVDGSLTVNHERYPLDVSARHVRTELAGGAGVVLRGRASASEVEVQLPQARPYLGRVELDLLLRPGRADIRQASFDGSDLTATFSGIWQWRDTKDVDLRIVADSRLEILDRLGYLDGFGGGSVHFEGGLRRRPGEWFLDGDFSSPAVTILGRRLSSLSGRAFGDNEALRLDIESSRYGYGSVTGEVLMSLAADGPKPVRVSLDLTDVDLVRLLQDQSIPVEGLAATVSGPLEYEFPRSSPRSGDGSGEFTVSPADSADGVDLAVSGTVPVVITDGVADSTPIRLTSASQILLAEGHYDLRANTGRFDFSVTTRKVQELFPLMSNLDQEPQPWQPYAGSGTLSGGLDIADGQVDTRLRVALEDVEADGYSARRMKGSLRVGGIGVEDLRLELSRPSAAMIVTGKVPFEDTPSADLPLQISVESAGWPLADVRAWFPWDLGLSGGFTGSLELGGDLQETTGTILGHLEPAIWGAVDAQALEVDLAFEPERLQVRAARLDLGSGLLSVEGAVGLGSPGSGYPEEEEGAVDLRFSSRGLDLADLPVIKGLAGGIGGQIDLAAALSGTLAAPRFSGVVECHGIVVGQGLAETPGPSKIAVEWADSNVKIDGALGQLVEVRGGGRLDSQGIDATFKLESGRLDQILTLLVGPTAAGIGGRGQGALMARAQWKELSEATALLQLDQLVIERSDQSLTNLEPVVLAFGTEGVLVESLYLAEPGTESEAFFAGRIHTGEDSRVDLNIQASLASEWFQPWLPGVEIKDGDFEVIGKISGSADQVQLNGQGELRNARALIRGFPSTLEGIRGMVLFYPERIVLDDAIAEMAGGRLRAGGSIDIEPGGEMPYRFQISGDDMSFRYPEGWLIHGDTEMTVTSTLAGRQVTGIARLDSALYVQDVQLIKSLFERRRVEAGDVEPWRSDTQLNLVVETSDGLRISNNLADITGGAELGLRGSLARPVLFGTVELDKGGRLIYSGQEYTVERGILSFTNPFRIEPVIDLVAKTRMREFDVTLSLSGTPDRLQTEFVSNPPLAELEVLALLTGGRDPGSRSADRSGAASDSGAAESFLYGQATSLVAGRFNQLFGLDQLRIDPLTSSTGNLSSARITVGKQLSRDLFVTYSYDPSQTEEQILELEWSLSRSLVLVLTQNGDGTYAVDARWEKAL